MELMLGYRVKDLLITKLGNSQISDWSQLSKKVYSVRRKIGTGLKNMGAGEAGAVNIYLTSAIVCINSCEDLLPLCLHLVC
jgi:hypothetical protein